MTQKLPPIPDPEQYWPQAEELLVAHFSRKRRRRALLIFLLLVVAGGSSLLFLRTEPQEKGAPASVESSFQQNTDPSKPSSAIAPIATVSDQPELQTANQKTTATERNTNEQQSAPDDQQRKSIQQVRKVSDKTYQKNVENTTNEQLTVSQQGSTDEELTYPGETTDQGFSKLCEEEMPLGEKQHELPVAITAVSFATESPADNQPVGDNRDSTTTDTKKDTAVSSNLLLTKVSVRSAVSILFTAGPMLTTAQRSANGSDAYLTRRDMEELADILPEAALQLSVSKGRWDLRAGIGMSVWGETVKYSPYSVGDYTSTRSAWQPYSYTVTDTDSAYIYGMLFYQTSNAVVNDSQLVNITDSLYGTRYDPSVLSANGKTRHTLLQIPVEAVWQFSRGRIGFGVSAGLTFGFLMSSNGSYLVEDQSRVKSWDSGMSTQMIVQASGGLEVSYRLSDVFRFSLVPTSRIALTPVREPGGADKTYRNFGIRAGVAYRIR
jgi:hypothetical protein